jgi:acetolactate synthase-1/2/3 large subunit
MGADAAWGDSTGPAEPNAVPQRAKVNESAIEKVANFIEKEGNSTVILLEHHGAEQAAMAAASKISNKYGCKMFNGTFPARVDGGPGRVTIDRLPYFPEQVLSTLDGVQNLILVGGSTPVSFFAYQNSPAQLIPEGCKVTRLSYVEEDAIDAMVRLEDRLGASKENVSTFERKDIGKPSGELNTKTIIQSLAATLPENVIVCTDSGGGNAAYPFCQNTSQNNWLSLTGGAIGQGGPCSVGAALACPDQRVLAMLGDGGAAYTIQALWTQARENLDVTTVIFANNSYNILDVEYGRLGVTDVGNIAASLFDIGNPAIDWVSLAKGFGVPGGKADTGEELCALLEQSYGTPGPFIIQANGEIKR